LEARQVDFLEGEVTNGWHQTSTVQEALECQADACKPEEGLEALGYGPAGQFRDLGSDEGPEQGNLDPQAVVDEIRDNLAYFFHDYGGALQLRGWTDRPGPNGKDIWEKANFFFDNLDGMARRAAEWSANPHVLGTYFTLSKLKESLSGPYATKKDVLSRPWLMVDVDPDRPNGQSATREERNLAKGVAQRIILGLHRDGWPEPVIISSGNGWHLYWRVNLANTPEAQTLVKRVLMALNQRYGILGKVKVDTQPQDPARVTKVPGTMTRKGEPTPERPHRRSWSWSRPEGRPRVVPMALLEELAKEAPEEAPRQKRIYSTPATDSYPAGKMVRVVPGGSGLDNRIVSKCKKRLRTHPSIEGEEGSRAALGTAICLVRGFLLSEEAALPYMLRWSKANARIHDTTEWNEGELVHKLREAARVGRMEWGLYYKKSGPPAELTGPQVQPQDAPTDPLETKLGRRPSFSFPEPVPVGEFIKVAADMPGYVWGDLIKPGYITLQTSQVRIGKSTLFVDKLRAMSAGRTEFCGFPLRAVKTVVLTQEPRGIWNERVEKYGLKGELVTIQGGCHNSPRPYMSRPSLVQWEDLILHLARMVEKGDLGQLIVDTTTAFWPVTNEWDPVQVIGAITPLRMLTDLGGAVLLVHHDRKSSGSNPVEGIRGSNAIPAECDIILSLRKLKASKSDPFQRRRRMYVTRRSLAEGFEVVLTRDPVTGYELVSDSRKPSEVEAPEVDQFLANIPTWPEFIKTKDLADKCKASERELGRVAKPYLEDGRVVKGSIPGVKSHVWYQPAPQ
jgi:hypothetical protein